MVIESSRPFNSISHPSGHPASDIWCALQIEEHLGLQVPFTAIFQYPTLRQLAAHILHLLRTPESAPISALQDASTGAPPFCVALAPPTLAPHEAQAARLKILAVVGLHTWWQQAFVAGKHTYQTR